MGSLQPIHAVHALGALVVAMTLVPLVRRDAWWIRAFEFPRCQILVLGLVVLVLEIVLREGKLRTDLAWRLPLLAAIGFQVFRIAPYTPAVSVQAAAASPREGSAHLKVMVANVLMTNRDAERLLEQVREQRPDLLLAVEVDTWWDARLRGLGESHPHAVRVPQENTYGMVLLSRLPIREAEVRYLVEPDIPSIHALVDLPGGADLRFIGLHPRPPAPQESTDTTERDAELLLVGREVAELGLPTIVAGDLNDVAWSYTTRLFQRVSGLLDPRIGRGLVNTFSAHSFWLRFPLDHVFHSADFKVVSLERLPTFGSDHFPIVLELAYERSFEEDQSEPRPEPGDLERANEKIEEATPTADGPAVGELKR